MYQQLGEADNGKKETQTLSQPYSKAIYHREQEEEE